MVTASNHGVPTTALLVDLAASTGNERFRHCLHVRSVRCRCEDEMFSATFATRQCCPCFREWAYHPFEFGKPLISGSIINIKNPKPKRATFVSVSACSH